MNAVTFFKSMWSQVKGNAALLVGKFNIVSTNCMVMILFRLGYMLGNLPLEKSGMISKEHVCEGKDYIFIILASICSLPRANELTSLHLQPPPCK